MNQKVWLITGVSKGLGLDLLKVVLAKGDIVVGTVRKKEDQRFINETFEADSYLIDLSNLSEIDSLVAYVINKYGRIDVLVNSAGYGAFGMVEEFTIEEVKAQMEVNYFAVWKLCQIVSPYFRSQNSGTIVQISSRLGLSSGAGKGIYSAGKFAVEGFSEALREELSPFGVHVLLVEPGALRTDFFGESINYTNQKIDDYVKEFGDIRLNTKSVHGNQPGNPVLVASAIVDFVYGSRNNFRIPFTSGTLQAIRDKVLEYQNILKEYETLAKSVEFKN